MLTDEQMMEMAPRISAMMQTPGWQDYRRVIADKIDLTISLGFSGPPEDLRYQQGAVDGLSAAVLTGDDVLAEVRNLTGEKREARRNRLNSKAVTSSFD